MTTRNACLTVGFGKRANPQAHFSVWRVDFASACAMRAECCKIEIAAGRCASTGVPYITKAGIMDGGTVAMQH